MSGSDRSPARNVAPTIVPQRKNVRPCVPTVSSSPPSTTSKGLNILLSQLPTNTDLERRLIAKVLEHVLSPDGHRLRLGNWSSRQLDKLTEALTASDVAEANEAVFFDISRHLVQNRLHLGTEKASKVPASCSQPPLSKPSSSPVFSTEI